MKDTSSTECVIFILYEEGIIQRTNAGILPSFKVTIISFGNLSAINLIFFLKCATTQNSIVLHYKISYRSYFISNKGLFITDDLGH